MTLPERVRGITSCWGMCTRKFESVPTVWTHLHDTARRVIAVATKAGGTGGGGERLLLLLLLLPLLSPALVSPLDGDGARRAVPLRRLRRGAGERGDGDREEEDGTGGRRRRRAGGCARGLLRDLEELEVGMGRGMEMDMGA